uniref:Uncharacterized protein n=1 Tax=Anopheles stephensi TaxID=30069 RepID=A0A182YEG7_ANOST
MALHCYDPPPSGTGGFLMDGSSTTGDYQSLPMVTSTINHTGHHPQYPYHHHQHYHQQQQQLQQQHHYPYTPYPNGPPPSYDTVVAQDELLASVSRRKRTDATDTRPTAGPSSHNNCSDPHSESHECDKQSSCPGSAATTPLLPKLSARRSQRSCGGSASNERTYGDDPADELLCRSGHQEWSDTHRDDDETANCSCPTVSTSSISRPGGGGYTGQPVPPPIYCRNCGYFVEGSRDSATSAEPVEVQTRSPCRPPVDPVERNETLLVDYETVSSDAMPARCSNDVNRNNTIDDGGTTDNATAPSVDIDMLTMQMMVASAASTVSGLTPGPTRQLDTVNNNTANETKNLRYAIGTVAPDSSSSSPVIGEDDRTWRRTPATPTSTNVNSENNNIIIDSSTTTTISSVDHRETPGTSDIIHQCPNTSSNQCCNQPDSYCTEEPTSTVEDHTNGNAGNEATATTETQPSSGIRSLLNENGLVRLDMSQIIDNTGLPTYEAALKLESSGYV